MHCNAAAHGWVKSCCANAQVLEIMHDSQVRRLVEREQAIQQLQHQQQSAEHQSARGKVTT